MLKPKTEKILPPKTATLAERIEFTRQHAEIGDRAQYKNDGAVIHEGIIVELTVSRIGGNSFAKIFKQRNKNGDFSSGDISISSAQFYPIKTKNGGVVLLGGRVDFNIEKSRYLSII